MFLYLYHAVFISPRRFLHVKFLLSLIGEAPLHTGNQETFAAAS